MFGVGIVSFVLLVASSLALIVPGLIVYVMLCVALPVCLIERKGVFASIGRSAALLGSIATAAPSFAVESIDTPFHDATEIDRAIDTFAQIPNGGLIVLPDTSNLVNRDRIIERTARHRLPAIYPFRYYVTSRWSDVLWNRFNRRNHASHFICRPHPAGYEAR